MKVCAIGNIVYAVLKISRQTTGIFSSNFEKEFRLCICEFQGKESTFRSDIMESDVIPHIEKNESEYAMILNCAAHNGDLHRLRHFVEAGADPNKADYNGRTALVCNQVCMKSDLVIRKLITRELIISHQLFHHYLIIWLTSLIT